MLGVAGSMALLLGVVGIYGSDPYPYRSGRGNRLRMALGATAAHRNRNVREAWITADGRRRGVRSSRGRTPDGA